MDKIDRKDLVIDTFSDAIAYGWHEMKITHIPTGIYVYAKGVNKVLMEKSLIEELKTKLFQPTNHGS